MPLLNRLLEMPRACQSPEGDSWACAIVHDWTGNEQLARAARWLIGAPLAIILLVVIGLVARWLLHRFIDRVVDRAREGVLPGKLGNGVVRDFSSSGQQRRAQRAATLGSLLKSIVTFLILAIVLFMAVSELGYNIAPLIASAGIVGLALGFGAQTLVKDFLSGMFMIFEDQYGVGDVVVIGDVSGTVEAVSLRVTRLRDVDGTVWYVRNGEILSVGNQSQNWARSVLDVEVAYSEDLSRVRRILEEVAHGLWDDEDFEGVIIEEPEVWGVQSLGANAVAVRVALKTVPLEQWRVSREMRERIKARFDAEGIEIPFPQRVVWHREASTPEPAGGRAEGSAKPGTTPAE